MLTVVTEKVTYFLVRPVTIGAQRVRVRPREHALGRSECDCMNNYFDANTFDFGRALRHQKTRNSIYSLGEALVVDAVSSFPDEKLHGTPVR